MKEYLYITVNRVFLYLLSREETLQFLPKCLQVKEVHKTMTGVTSSVRIRNRRASGFKRICYRSGSGS